MKTGIRTVLLVLTLFMAACVPAMAQEQPPRPLVEISGGYNMTRLDLAGDEGEDVHAFATSLKVNLAHFGRPNWGARFDLVDLNRPVKAQFYLLGAEYRFNLGKVLPDAPSFQASKHEVFVFAQGGAQRQTIAGNVIATGVFSVGGGVDLQVDERVAFRLIQLGYVRAKLLDESGAPLRNHLRLNTGLNLRF